MSDQVPEVSAIVPAHNEEENIGPCAREITAVFLSAGADFEIVFIDDGSTDRTWEQIRSAHDSNSRVKGIHLSRNFGKEAALAAGLDMAKGKAVIVLDADLQHPPSLIPQMLQAWREGALVVEGVKRKRVGEPLVRRCLSRLYSKVAKSMTGVDWTNASDFKLVDRQAVHALRSMNERRRFFRGMAAWIGFPSVQIEFDVAARTKGTSKWSGGKLVWLAWHTISSFSSTPLRIIHLTGLAFLVFAIALSVRALQLWFGGTAIGGFTTVVILLLIIGGLVLLSLAIIAEYIIAIYDEVKGRPHYIVQSTID